MNNIKTRIEKAEGALSLHAEPLIVEVVHFGGPLPAEERRGNITVRHVAFETVQERLEGGAARERCFCENGDADGIRHNPTN